MLVLALAAAFGGGTVRDLLVGDAPVAWLRFEPAGPVGDLRLTWWPGGEETVLATAEYHGIPVHWGVTSRS